MSDESQIEALQVPKEIGVLPLRNSVLFPHAIMPISVGRRKTLNLLDDVVRESKLIAVVSQRNPTDDDPEPNGLYRVGTVARILKVVKLSGNNVNLIIQGIQRVRVDRFISTEPFVKASVTPVDDVHEKTVELEGLVRSLVDQFQQLVQVSQNISSDLGEMVLSAAAKAFHVEESARHLAKKAQHRGGQGQVTNLTGTDHPYRR